MAKEAKTETKEPRKPLTPGDPVTLVLPDHVVMAEVHSSTSTKDGFGCVLTSRTKKSIVSEHKLKDEGITWLLGYHLADSDEVKACRTAKGLG